MLCVGANMYARNLGQLACLHNREEAVTFAYVCRFSLHVAYTMAKYGMSMCVLGMTEEFRSFNIGVNALWPKTSTINFI